MTQYPQQSRPWELGYATDNRAVASFFNTVYAWMAVGLALTGVVGWFVSHSSLMYTFYESRGLYTVVALGSIAVAWYAQAKAGQLSVGVATTLFLVYSVLIGTLISAIFLIYNAKTLGAAFLLTGGTFATMSIYGFVTKRNLSRLGSIFVMLAIGFVLASIVNIWLASDGLSWLITYAILVLFVGITAYETQLLKRMAEETPGNPEMAARFGIFGSLVLYICFINLFLSILRILGDRRS